MSRSKNKPRPAVKKAAAKVKPKAAPKRRPTVKQSVVPPPPPPIWEPPPLPLEPASEPPPLPPTPEPEPTPPPELRKGWICPKHGLMFEAHRRSGDPVVRCGICRKVMHLEEDVEEDAPPKVEELPTEADYQPEPIDPPDPTMSLAIADYDAMQGRIQELERHITQWAPNDAAKDNEIAGLYNLLAELRQAGIAARQAMADIHARVAKTNPLWSVHFEDALKALSVFK